MELFEATPFDITELSGIFDDYRCFYKQPSNIDACRQFISERIQNKDSVIFIVKNENEIVGFTQLYPLFSSVQMKKLWMLNDLFVIKSARRKGVAGMLITQCRKLACDTNAAGLLLETGKDNTEGNKLYPTEDFQLIDSSNFYFWKTVIAG